MSITLRTALPWIAIAALAACHRKGPEPTSQTTTTSSEISTVSDARIVQEVDDAIGADPRLAIAARNLTIASQSGMVMLGGSVPDEATKQRVVELANGAEGSLGTVDRVVVSATRDQRGEESDPKIERAIAGALASDEMLAEDAPAISAHASHGIVTLRGRVGSAEERDAIERKVERLPGVVTTVDQIEVVTAAAAGPTP